MTLTALFIGVAAISGATGVGSGIKAGLNVNKAKRIGTSSDEKLVDAGKRLDERRCSCGKALEKLGEEKLFIINNSISEFLESFQKLKNVNLSDTDIDVDLDDIHIDKTVFTNLGEMKEFALAVASGVLAGGASGALTAFGAYGAASTFATASTGTAISTLYGVAANNATLAFFGGGPIASGGLGVAGGTAILGGLVAGPALMVMGLIANNRTNKILDKAYIHQAEVEEIVSQLDIASVQCEAICRRTYMIYTLLARLDSYFLPLVYKLEEIVENEGADYLAYSPESKKTVASVAGVAGTIKAVLDTPLLTEDGELTEESEAILMKQLKPKRVIIKVKKSGSV